MKAPTARARVICNPASGGGTYEPDRLREVLSGFELDWVETQGSDDATTAAKEWYEGLLIVAGGDGTINDVVNGLGKAGFPEGVTLALLPTGTGNDLAATLAIPEDLGEAEDVIRQNRVRTLDAARVLSYGVGERFFINVATGGIGARISSGNNEELKSKWGKLSYLRASLEVARNYGVRDATLRLDGEERRIRAVNMVVGNCRYAGGGWPAAPKANPEDGYLDKEGVFYTQAREIRVETQPGLEFTVDGEIIGDEPAEFVVIPRALKVIIGPGYVPEPRGNHERR